MPYELLDAAVQETASCQTQLEGLTVALPADALFGVDEQEVAARRKLAGDAHQLLEDAKAAVLAGKPEAITASLISEANQLACQLRDRVLDAAVASSPIPDPWPM
ncbi:hypothetical protein [Streptomyces sp. SP18BB07]|uniref:hypothetical protein n=1 Tax=Streptomyces sp. SP18BB07 TaxID=3002522 RepID=UPI002E783D3E|nr:hypothetical protein [Streptomyces sp. SP18BB07]MEE1764340.1 hypothetical protein [Streptomyces sp. SP18BB07]